MPKTKKQKEGLPGEGRPPDLTFACFFKETKPKKKSTTADTTSTTRKKTELSNTEPSGDQETSGHGNIPALAAEQDFKLPYCVGTVHDSSIQENNSRKDEETKSFKIMRTKKGGFPVLVEKRAKGKKVTVVRQVTGNSKSFLQLLKTKFGTGGLLKPGEVEIQGDFEDKLLKYLQENRSFMIPYNSI